MFYYELSCQLYLKKDLTFKESFEKLAKFLSFTLFQAGEGSLHYEKKLKFYVFSGFKAEENEKDIYKNGTIKEFKIRSLNENFINLLEENLRKNINNANFLLVKSIKKRVEQFFISELSSLTPTIVSTSNSRFWTSEEDGSLTFLYQQLQNNLINKYENFYGEKINFKENFIQVLEQKNHKPQNIQISKNDKNIRFFGNKFKIIPNDDKISQNLAFIALACGLGEKNSYGAGFCLGKWVKK